MVFKILNDKFKMTVGVFTIGMKKPKWSKKEVNILRKYYKVLPTTEIKKLLPNRSVEAIQIKAKRLGLRKTIEETYLSRDEQLELSEGEWGYLAGIIDGDGSIGVQICTRTIRPIIIISNTDINFIKWISNKLSVKYYPIKETKGYNKKVLYEVTIAGYSKVYQILKHCLPYLKIKRKHAEIVLKMIEIRKKMKVRTAYPKEFLDLAVKLKELSSRNPKIVENFKKALSKKWGWSPSE